MQLEGTLADNCAFRQKGRPCINKNKQTNRSDITPDPGGHRPHMPTCILGDPTITLQLKSDDNVKVNMPPTLLLYNVDVVLLRATFFYLYLTIYIYMSYQDLDNCG